MEAPFQLGGQNIPHELILNGRSRVAKGGRFARFQNDKAHVFAAGVVVRSMMMMIVRVRGSFQVFDGADEFLVVRYDAVLGSVVAPTSFAAAAASLRQAG